MMHILMMYIHIWPGLGKPVLSAHQLISTFCLYMKAALMHYPVLDHRWPGLLLQTAFYRCCWTTRMHFSALTGINRTAWGTRLLLRAAMAHPVDCTSAGPILRAQHCCLGPNGCFNPPSASHPPPPTPLPTHPRPIDSICDIIGAIKFI